MLQNLTSSKYVDHALETQTLLIFYLEKMFRRAITTTRTRRYQSNGSRTRGGRGTRRRAYGGGVPLPSHDFHSTRKTGDNMDSYAKIWVRGGFAANRIVFTPKVRRLVHEVVQLNLNFNLLLDLMFHRTAQWSLALWGTNFSLTFLKSSTRFVTTSNYPDFNHTHSN
jgi:hypothetical protein